MRNVEIQRLRHVPGELLRGRDLRDQLAHDAQLRWWHNRALHRAYGVAEGMSVELSAGGASVVVTPGVAYDARARELLLNNPHEVSLPGGKQSMILIFGQTGLAWRPVDQLDRCAEAVVAHLSFGKDGKPTIVAVGRTHPQASPRIGSGTTSREGTPWEPWASPPTLERPPLGMQVTVDTSAFGFTDVPCYLAWLQWPNPVPGPVPLLALAMAQQYVEEPAADRFVFRVALFSGVRLPGTNFPLPPFAGPREHEIVSLARAQQLSVCWLGVSSKGRDERSH